jgi:hypothetical protein
MMVAAPAGMAQRAEVAADSPAKAQVSFTFDRPGLPVPQFTLTVNEDGTGRYVAEEVLPASSASLDTEAQTTQHIDRAISLTAAATAQIFAAARAMDRFNVACESTAKNIADTGKKTLRYTGAGGDGSCTYNYSQDKRVTMLTELFQGIAVTLDLGRRLEFEHRFDRLGLDATMAKLTEQANSGSAKEVVTIAATLRSIAGDSEVLERVRLRAARLLKQAQPGG